MGVDNPRLRKSIEIIKHSMIGPFQFSCDTVKNITADCSKIRSIVKKQFI